MKPKERSKKPSADNRGFTTPAGLDTPPRFPSASKMEEGSLYVMETRAMELGCLDEIRKGEQKFGKLEVPEHPIHETLSTGEYYENQQEAHPEFIDSQRLDGAAEVIPAPGDREALDEYNKQQDKQKNEKQLRLNNIPQNMPKFNPRPGG